MSVYRLITALEVLERERVRRLRANRQRHTAGSARLSTTRSVKLDIDSNV
jgi:hypothetical protein